MQHMYIVHWNKKADVIAPVADTLPSFVTANTLSLMDQIHVIMGQRTRTTHLRISPVGNGDLFVWFGPQVIARAVVHHFEPEGAFE